MREILFRGKCVNSDEWVEGAYYKQTKFYGDAFEDHIIISTEDELEDNMMIFDSVIPETVGQFTGLYDKYGKKIFEGDIINCYTFSKLRDYRNSVVRWDEVLLCFMAGRNSLYGGHADDIYEIVGNIHDNPELLEDKL